jgi:hypothetical protein
MDLQQLHEISKEEQNTSIMSSFLGFNKKIYKNLDSKMDDFVFHWGTSLELVDGLLDIENEYSIGRICYNSKHK